MEKHKFQSYYLENVRRMRGRYSIEMRIILHREFNQKVNHQEIKRNEKVNESLRILVQRADILLLLLLLLLCREQESIKQ